MTFKTNIFVSSTFSDLQDYRIHVKDVLHRLGLIAHGMEFFGSSPNTPKDECLRIVKTCHIYVGIVAMRYGSVDFETGKSFTHLEYETAQSLNLPSFIYLIDENEQPVLPKNIDFGDNAEKLISFKKLLKENHLVSFFTTPEDLAAKLAQDFYSYYTTKANLQFEATKLKEIVENIPRIDWLNEKRFTFLKKKIGDDVSFFPSDLILKEVIELLLVGNRLAAVFLLTNTTNSDLRECIDVLMRVNKSIFKVIESGIQVAK